MAIEQLSEADQRTPDPAGLRVLGGDGQPIQPERPKLPPRCRLKPLGDRVVVLPTDDAQRITQAGIHIPDQAREVPTSGTVLAVGPGVQGLKVGERVVYGKYVGTPFVIDDFELMILPVADILASVEAP